MFCPHCGNNLRGNLSYCGNCGATLKLPNTQNRSSTSSSNNTGNYTRTGNYNSAPSYREIKKFNQAFMYDPEHAKASGQIAFLLAFSLMTILLWFMGMISEDGVFDSVSLTWDTLIKVAGEDAEYLVHIFRWGGIFMLVINIFICSGVLSSDDYRQTRTGFVWSVFTGLINLIFHSILVYTLLDELDGYLGVENLTIWNILFFISCLVLFFMPFSIAHKTGGGSLANYEMRHDSRLDGYFAQKVTEKSDENIKNTLDDWLEAGLITPEEYEKKMRNLK